MKSDHLRTFGRYPKVSYALPVLNGTSQPTQIAHLLRQIITQVVLLAPTNSVKCRHLTPLPGQPCCRCAVIILGQPGQCVCVCVCDLCPTPSPGWRHKDGRMLSPALSGESKQFAGLFIELSS